MDLNEMRTRFRKKQREKPVPKETPGVARPGTKVTNITSSPVTLRRLLGRRRFDILHCISDGGKLRVRPWKWIVDQDALVKTGYDTGKNVRFNRSERAEGRMWAVRDLKLSSDGTHYTVANVLFTLTVEEAKSLRYLAAKA